MLHLRATSKGRPSVCPDGHTAYATDGSDQGEIKDIASVDPIQWRVPLRCLSTSVGPPEPK